MDFQTARKVMVDSQVRVNDVTDRALQAALLAVPREALCAPDRAFSAYAEVEVPVTARRSLMLPRDLSKLLMAAAPKPGERALVMSGAYAAAVLAQMGLDVTLQESDAEALAIAAPTLSAAGVTTVEAPLELAPALVEASRPDTAILLDCATMWLSNLMEAGRDTDAAVAEFSTMLAGLPGPVVVVTNEVGHGIVPENALARAFRDAHGRMNQRLAAAMDHVVLVVAGRALVLPKSPVPEIVL